MADAADIYFGNSDSDASFDGFEPEDLIEIEQNQLPTYEADNPDRDYDDNADLRMNWSREATEKLTPPFTGTPGLDVNLPEIPSPIDYFNLFITDTEYNIITMESNRYFDQIRRNRQPRPHARMNSFYDTCNNEMKKFLGMTILMGLVEKPRLELYWSTDGIDETPFFPQCMPRDRFLNLLSFMHVADNETALQRGNPDFDPIYKIRPIYDVLSLRFRTVYTPEQNICIDEAMAPWKGRLRFRQYIPSKPDKWGIKLYPICESSSGYICDFDVYTGADYVPNPDADPFENHEGHTYHVVMGLLRRAGFLDKGYSVYMDNYYASPTLFDTLFAQNTIAVGTVRANRKEMPKAIKNTKLKKGEVIFRQRDNLLALKWFDKRDVFILSTKHLPTMSIANDLNRDGDPIVKPTSVLDYNKNMGGVDLFDQICKYYTFSRKTLKWWVKLFFHFINLAITNSYILYKKNHNGPKPLSQYMFRKELARELINSHQLPRPARNRPIRNDNNENRLFERHFPDLIPAKDGAKVANPTRKCVVCNPSSGHRRAPGETSKRKETRYWCADCKQALCVVPYFRRYHTLKNFKVNAASSSSDSE